LRPFSTFAAALVDLGKEIALPPPMASASPARNVTRPTSTTYTPPPVPIAPAATPIRLSAARLAETCAPRIATGITELDRVLGGGLVSGSFVLLGADPGMGKSTLVLQAAHSLCRTDRDGALYVTGEESAQQVALRALRLGVENDRIQLVATRSIDDVLALADHQVPRPSVLVIDSIQTMATRECDSDAGSLAQVVAVMHRLAQFAKDSHTPVIAIGHVTKDGELAGPKTIEHLVDVVLYLESAGGARRRLIASKNRHGSTDEIGSFEMRESGLVCVEDGHDAMAERAAGAAGSAVFCAVVGERAQLVEIQALVGAPKNDERARGSLSVSGVDAKRVTMILAVLARHAEIDVSDRDVFVSVTAGMRVTDPAADLAIALAIASSVRDLPIEQSLACFGELGLAGEVRGVSFSQTRHVEAKIAGFSTLASATDVVDIAAKTIATAIDMAIGSQVSS
jgi:DNA repair protein RadA/Sms